MACARFIDDKCHELKVPVPERSRTEGRSSMLRNFARQGSIVVALLLVSAGVALAAGGGGKSSSSSSSISLALMAAATTSGPTGPSYGQAVSFNVSTNATSQPF